jgi:hypothetical protein
MAASPAAWLTIASGSSGGGIVSISASANNNSIGVLRYLPIMANGGGYIKVTTDIAIAGYLAFGTQTALSAVPPQIIR